MRSFIAAILGLVFIVAPYGAHADNSSLHVFGSANCSEHIACPGDYSGQATSDPVTSGNTCVLQFFGYSSPSGIFEDSGLDSNGCLTAKSGVIPKGMGAQLYPRCCVAQRQDNSCSLHCDLIAQ